jgi:hypothetical protein
MKNIEGIFPNCKANKFKGETVLGSSQREQRASVRLTNAQVAIALTMYQTLLAAQPENLDSDATVYICRATKPRGLHKADTSQNGQKESPIDDQ